MGSIMKLMLVFMVCLMSVGCGKVEVEQEVKLSSELSGEYRVSTYLWYYGSSETIIEKSFHDYTKVKSGIPYLLKKQMIAIQPYYLDLKEKAETGIVSEDPGML